MLFPNILTSVLRFRYLHYPKNKLKINTPFFSPSFHFILFLFLKRNSNLLANPITDKDPQAPHTTFDNLVK